MMKKTKENISNRKANKSKRKPLATIDLYPGDLLYDRCFADALALTDLMDLDELLDGYLETQFAGDLAKYSRFLHVLVRKHENVSLTTNHCLTIKEWISDKSVSKNLVKQTRSLKRENNDQLTSMGSQQTAMFVHYLRMARIILRDEYLTNSSAGVAFNMLTGYSADTLRLKMANHELEGMKTKANLTELLNQLTRLSNLIEAELRTLKPSS